MNDTSIINFDYQTETKNQNLEDIFREICQHIKESAAEEARKASDPNYSYEQVWIMSKEAWNSLPDSPTWFDMVAAGGMFQGWQWVKKEEANGA